jgi:S1-C subfamily serine protease
VFGERIWAERIACTLAGAASLCFAPQAANSADSTTSPETTVELTELAQGTLLQKIAVLSALAAKQDLDPRFFKPLANIVGDASVPDAVRLRAALALRSFPDAHATIVPVLVQAVVDTRVDPQSRNEACSALLSIAKAAFDRDEVGTLTPLQTALKLLAAARDRASNGVANLDPTVEQIKETVRYLIKVAAFPPKRELLPRETSLAVAAKESIAYLTVEVIDTDTGDSSRVTGTGFVVSEQGLIVTASHLFNAWAKQTESNKLAHPIVATLSDSPGRGSANINLDMVSLSDPELEDVAILSLPQEPGRTYAHARLCASEENLVAVGAELTAFGFPYGRLYQPVAVKLGLKSGDHWNASGALSHGMSGGPVYNSNGYVVGIVRGGLEGDPNSTITSFSAARTLVSPPLADDCPGGPQGNRQ